MLHIVLFSLLTLISHAEEVKSGLERLQEEQTHDKELCQGMKPGDKPRFIREKSPMWSAAVNRAGFSNDYMNYRLEMKDANTYRVVLPVRFVPGESYDGGDIPVGLNEEGRKRFIDQKYRDQIRNCLPSMNKLIPKVDGKSIVLDLDETYDQTVANNPDSKLVQIEIIKKGGRPNMRHYQSDLVCSSVAHELIHITGLGDLYREGNASEGVPKLPSGKDVPGAQESKVNTYDCRVLVPRNNVMVNSHAYEPNSAPCKYVGSCDCIYPPCVTPANHKFTSNGWLIGKMQTLQCPPGYTANPVTDPEIYATSEVNRFTNTHNPTESFSVMKLLPNTPLLAPAQARHLIYPGCMEKNRRFYRCSIANYDTSVEQGCGKLRDSCNNDPHWLD